jgi:hypothetical protein
VRINTDVGVIELVNEPTYSFGSADNVRGYRFARNLAEDSRPSSIHGIALDGEPLAVFGRGGGCSVVHAHSLAYVRGLLYVAVGDCVVCVELKPFAFKWVLQTDPATCFGVYFEERHGALISHGELEIVRFSPEGTMIWRASGADIFSGPLSLMPHCIEAVDWNGHMYRFSYVDGEQCA